MPDHKPKGLSRAVLFFLLVIVAAVVHLAYYYPQLPLEVPTHFGPGGEPDSWSSRGSFIFMQIILLGSIGLIFAGCGWFIRKIPHSLISLPNKEYWLASERKTDTLDVMTDQMFWFGAATMLFFGIMNHLSILVALGQRETLGSGMWLLTLAYVGFSLVWSIRLIMRFSKKPG